MKRWIGYLWAVSAPAAAPLLAQDPLAAIRTYRDAHQGAIVAELRDFLSLTNVAGNLPNIRRNAEALVAMLEQRGAKAQILETGAEPVVFGEIGDPSKPTILFYCHYDGQPVNPASWQQTDPWQPVLRTKAIEAGGTVVAQWPGASDTVNPDWRLYARSASDDKSPIVALMQMLDAWNAAGVAPPNHLKFIFEGDEEAGSQYLAETARRYRDLLRADLAVMADGPIHESGRPSAFFGLRGIAGVTLTVYGPIRPLHSGHYGNWAPNPAMRLAQLLASMKGPSGEVLVPGWEDDMIPLSDADQRALAEFPHDDEQQRLQFQLGAVDGRGGTRHQLIAHPSLNLRGMRSLFVGPEARTLVPDVAVAELDLRLVAGNTPERQVEKLGRHIERQGYTVVREDPDSATRVNTPRLVKLTWSEGYPAGRTPIDQPVAQAVIEALRSTGLGAPVVVPTMGGSGPAYVFTDILQQPFVVIPIVNHDNNQHAENENVRLGHLFRGMEILGAAASAKIPKAPATP
ncbi:MAG: M20/M25/M40 family metallo-hydrolase [Gemmatimonadetes bacterium]|nr:M20/M25/M40 family metallo-hydrolase [Gemmatimonadota bacterium]